MRAKISVKLFEMGISLFPVARSSSHSLLGVGSLLVELPPFA